MAHIKSVPSDPVNGAAVVDTWVLRSSSIIQLLIASRFLVAKIVNFNCFGCPLTSKDAIMDPERNRASKLPSTLQHNSGSTSSLYRITGLWLKSSLINHSCDPTCRRSFLGDLQIIRAARDLPAGTELTFSYLGTVGKAPEDSRSLNKRLLDGWGFECSCPICVEDRELTPAIKNRHLELLEEFETISNNNLKRKRNVLQKLESTYSRSPNRSPKTSNMAPSFLFGTSLCNRQAR